MKNFKTFNNGLRLVACPIKTTRCVSVGIFVGVGSSSENKRNNGISHFIEHMLFKGTQKRSSYDIANDMESIGININAYTSKNMTVYYTESIDEHIEKCFEMLSDIFYNSTFTEENMQKERGVILEEISMGEDDPSDLCYEQFSAGYFGEDNSLAYPILGTAKTVKKITPKLIKEYMAKYYVPQNIVISVAGNYDEKNLEILIDKYFFTEKNIIGEEIKLPERHVPSKILLQKKKPIEQSHVVIGFKSYESYHKNTNALGIVCNVLGGGMSSRLFQKVREELGLVYTIYAVPIDYKKDGYFSIYFATNPSTVKKAVEVIRDCIDDVIKNGITEDEFNKGKEQLKSSLVFSSEKSSSIMRLNGKCVTLTNEPFDIDEKLKSINTVTNFDIKDAIDFIFNLDNVVISHVGKSNKTNLLDIFDKKTAEATLSK